MMIGGERISREESHEERESLEKWKQDQSVKKGEGKRREEGEKKMFFYGMPFIC